jgi:hypothetical protein
VCDVLCGWACQLTGLHLCWYYVESLGRPPQEEHVGLLFCLSCSVLLHCACVFVVGEAGKSTSAYQGQVLLLPFVLARYIKSTLCCLGQSQVPRLCLQCLLHLC